MPTQKRVTHQDVAKLAGVSTAVVSYVINNGPRPTSLEVRERVLRAIAELDYHPSALARSLRSQRTNTIAFIASDYYDVGDNIQIFTAPSSSAILTGLVTETKANGYYLLVFPIGVEEELNQLQVLLRSGRLDGVVVRLVQESSATDPLLEMISSVDIPCVCIERPGDPRFGFSTVTFDDERGAYTATQYLIEQGHTRIAHIHGDLRYDASLRRLSGYRQALTDANLPIDEQIIAGKTWLSADAIAAAQRIMQGDAPPTAILAASDTLAFPIIQFLQSQGYRIPGDVSVIGFDDIPLARDMAPALTSIRIPFVEIGRKAVNLTLDAMAGSSNANTMSDVLPVELIRRGTA
ncbi:MAG: LacI family DNA-binding transcriptional regulator [Chloroflexota bacterium]